MSVGAGITRRTKNSCIRTPFCTNRLTFVLPFLPKIGQQPGVSVIVTTGQAFAVDASPCVFHGIIPPQLLTRWNRIGRQGNKQIQSSVLYCDSRFQKAPIHRSCGTKHRLIESLFDDPPFGTPTGPFSHRMRVRTMRRSDGNRFGFH